MKKILIPLLALCASAAIAADETTTTSTTTTKTTTSTGTISEYAPGTTFIVKETSGPVTYRYGKTVTYVTKSGKTLTDEDVKTLTKRLTPTLGVYVVLIIVGLFLPRLAVLGYLALALFILIPLRALRHRPNHA